MLEFYYNWDIKKFPHKAKLLSEELLSILNFENIRLESTEEENIPKAYRSLLNNDLFNTLNNLYFTIRKNNGADHPLPGKYLPELKNGPTSKFLFTDFFSGAGGLSQGLINAGFQPAYVNDNSIDALETYYFNRTLPLKRFYKGDIRNLVVDFANYKYHFKEIKVVVGGPPCQGFSTANRRNFKLETISKGKRFIEDERNILYKYFVKLIGLIKPEYFIMENVIGTMRVQNQFYRISQTGCNFCPFGVPNETRGHFRPLSCFWNFPKPHFFLLCCLSIMQSDSSIMSHSL